MVKPVWNLSESVFFFEEMKGLSVDDCQRVFIFLFLLAAATLLYKHTKRRLSRVVQKLTKKKTYKIKKWYIYIYTLQKKKLKEHFGGSRGLVALDL